MHQAIFLVHLVKKRWRSIFYKDKCFKNYKNKPS